VKPEIAARLYETGLYRGRSWSGPDDDAPRWHHSDGLDRDPVARAHYSRGWRAGRLWRAAWGRKLAAC
jgi:hypothetical protein